MKKTLAISAITAIMTAAAEMPDANITEVPVFNEASMDLFVTGCQCKSPKPRWGKKPKPEDYMDWS